MRRSWQVRFGKSERIQHDLSLTELLIEKAELFFPVGQLLCKYLQDYHMLSELWSKDTRYNSVGLCTCPRPFESVSCAHTWEVDSGKFFEPINHNIGCPAAVWHLKFTVLFGFKTKLPFWDLSYINMQPHISLCVWSHTHTSTHKHTHRLSWMFIQNDSNRDLIRRIWSESTLY